MALLRASTHLYVSCSLRQKKTRHVLGVRDLEEHIHSQSAALFHLHRAVSKMQGSSVLITSAFREGGVIRGEGGVIRGEEGVIRVREVSSRVRKVSSGVREVSSGVREVSSGVRKVSSGVREVSSRVRKVSSGVREVSSGVREVSSGVREVSSGVREGERYHTRVTQNRATHSTGPSMLGLPYIKMSENRYSTLSLGLLLHSCVARKCYTRTRACAKPAYTCTPIHTKYTQDT